VFPLGLDIVGVDPLKLMRQHFFLKNRDNIDELQKKDDTFM
jgi:hypothetical protein